MDANGTRFHLFLGRGDWGNCLWFDAAVGEMRPLDEAWLISPVEANDSGLAWDGERAELTLQPRLFRFTAAPKDVPPKLEQRRGAARDRFGNWYWIDESRQKILVNSAGTGVTTDYWPDADCPCPPEPRFGDFAPVEAAPAPPLLTFSGLAVTEDHYLVVGVLAGATRAGLLIFDLHAGGPPRQLFWPATIPFAPFDMAPMPGGGVWILDREHRRYWALDRQLNVIRASQYASPLSAEVAGDFQPLEGGGNPERSPSLLGAFGDEDAMQLNGNDPIAIEALPDCTVLVLDYDPSRKFSLIYRYRFDQQLGLPVSTEVMAELIEEEKQAAFSLVGHDFAFVPEHNEADQELGNGSLGCGSGYCRSHGCDDEGEIIPDRLYVVAADGNQAFAFTIHQENEQVRLAAVSEYLPMRLFGGKALVGAGGFGYYDFGQGWIPLVAQSRPRYVEEAIFLTPVRDGREPDCVWHRLMLDACIPHEAEVVVWSRAANNATELATMAWQREPTLYRRGDGSEQPYSFRQRREGRETWELLFQRAQGRFLQLRVVVRGNGRVSPRLYAMRLYYPRFSYLVNYLPSVYRDDEQSASFLDRFLANVEGFYTALEDKIAAVQILFDAKSAPPETLEWLASWYNIALDPTWCEDRRRLFIRHAMDFFQWRGTRRGLLMALRLTLDACPDESIFSDLPQRVQRGGTVRIIEKYRTRTLPNVALGDSTEVSGGTSGLRTLRQVDEAGKWQPVQGGEELRRLYGKFLSGADNAPVDFPLQAPNEANAALAWTEFARQRLGFVPSAGEGDLRRWQEFLARRYQRIDTLNTAYALGIDDRFTHFEDVPLPSALPPDGAALVDWVQFEAIVLAMRRVAHQFSVLVPTSGVGAARLRDQEAQRLELAKRIIELEKPAHTVFDVKFYWALFRVGAARLGEDTLLDRGSRAPELMPPFVLGQGYLAEAFLTAGHPQNVTNRQVVGSMKLGE